MHSGIRKTRRALYVLLGSFFVLLGLVGAILPVMPSTVFFIIAAYFYARSSPVLHEKLRTLPYIGEQIAFWEEHRAMPRKAKRMAIFFAVLGISGATVLGVLARNWMGAGLALLAGAAMLGVLLRIRSL